MDSAIWGLVGTVIGALASIATTWLSARSNDSQHEARANWERLERANAFQRETLLELQEAIHDALRLAHRAYIEDCDSLRKGSPWSKAMLGEELSESIRLAFRKAALLIERVADDAVRLQIKTLMTTANQAMLATSEAEARAHLERCQEQAERGFELLGNVLRSHY